MLFFNWDAITAEANGNPFKAVEILELYRLGRILKYGLKRRLYGKSFLLNAEDITTEKRVDILYVYQYIQLAARRDLALYKLYGIKSLPLLHYPDIRLDSLKTNPLLNITKSDINFKYE